MIIEKIYQIRDLFDDGCFQKEQYKSILDELCDVMENISETDQEAYVRNRYTDQYCEHKYMDMWIQRARDVEEHPEIAYHAKHLAICDVFGDNKEIEEKSSEVLADEEKESLESLLMRCICFANFKDCLDENSISAIGNLFRIFEYHGKKGSYVYDVDTKMKREREDVKNAKIKLINLYKNSNKEKMKCKIDEILSEYFNKSVNMYYSPNVAVDADGLMNITIYWMTDPRWFVDPYMDFQNILENAMKPEKIKEIFDVKYDCVRIFGDPIEDCYLRSTQKNVNTIENILKKKGVYIKNANIELIKIVNEFTPVIKSFTVEIPNIMPLLTK